ncbi:serine hydrolase domain-containing protein [Arthrobacter rhizosphaerae]|uniref:serine hydrolase domain-containing protein n=1 Tax=Arthrobacter rhizosphaerae TaxID=2855490 RepID=UPI001FF1AE8B|nr:serine hydrolase domain-containing protein [Arthrobacter rhizosphaerae]
MQLSDGHVDPEFGGVLDLFESFLAEDPLYSAQVSVYLQGRKVVDLVGGPDFNPGDITGTYSCSKGVAACVVALLVQDGILDLEQRMAHYWPEFAVHGKGGLTVAQALSHQAGLLGIEGGFRLDEFTTEAAAEKLAAAEPLWLPGTTFGYHALTIGILMEELCRRTAGISLQELYDSRLRVPLDIDFFLGLPEDQEPRYRNVLYDVDDSLPWEDPLSLDGLNSNSGVSSIMELPNHRIIRANGMSSAGGVGSAGGLARLYAAAITGVDGGAAFLTEATISAMTQERVWGLDRSSGQDNAFAVGFMKAHPSRNFGSYRAFGHEGANAALGFADPSYGIGFGYVPRRQEDGRTPGRAHRLAHAVRQAAVASSNSAEAAVRS